MSPAKNSDKAMDNMELSRYDPLGDHRRELLSALVDAVKLEFKVRDMRSNPREEYFFRFYECQCALDEKCRALSELSLPAEIQRSNLALCDYLDCLATWSRQVTSLISKYIEAQAPKNVLDFGNTYQGASGVISVEYFARWIRHLENRMRISQSYLKTISRRDPAELSTSMIGTASSGSGLRFGNAIDSSTLEEGETGGYSPQIGAASECSELLERVSEFHDSYKIHRASLTAVEDAVQGIVSEKEKARQPIKDPDVFRDLVRTQTTQVLYDQMPAIMNMIRAEVFLEALNHQEEVYTKIWNAMTPIFDITESICTRMHGGS